MVFSETQVKSFTNSSTVYFSQIVRSQDGSYLVAIVHGGAIYISTNNGTSWNAVNASVNGVSLNGLPWGAVAISPDGTTIVAATNGSNGNVYVSLDSGTNWSKSDTLSANWTGLAVSNNNGSGIVIASVCSNSTAIWISSNNGGSSFIPVNAVGNGNPAINWTSVSCSLSGRFMLAVGNNSGSGTNGGVYLSNTFGENWTRYQASTSGQWTSCACSLYNVLFLAASTTDIFIYNPNNDSFLNITSTSTNVGATGFTNWSAVSLSSDDSKIAAVSNPGYVFTTDTSTYGGTGSGNPTWTNLGSSVLKLSSVTSSSDGKTIMVIAQDYNTSGGIYKYTYIIPPVPCFHEDTKILTNKGYVCVKELRKGDLVKTMNYEYLPIVMIGKRDIDHTASESRVPDDLYKCSPSEYPELIEDLVLTGRHAILVDKLETIDMISDYFMIDNKYKLAACLDKRTTVYERQGTYTVYHLALENDDFFANYGIYANGLLVESCSLEYLKEKSNMYLVE